MKIYTFEAYNKNEDGCPKNIMVISEDKENAFKALLSEFESNPTLMSHWDIDKINLVEDVLTEGVWFEF